MAITKSERWDRIHAESMREFDASQTAVWDDRMQCLQDRRFCFIAGAQWEGGLGEMFANRPKFEANKVYLAVKKIINEYLNNRIDAIFIQKDGEPDNGFADVCNGLYRADEHDSVAQEAYDNAMTEAVSGGIGAWRLRAVYADEDDDDDERQRGIFEAIHDADSTVFFDRQAKRYDKSDARWCWVLNPMTPEAYIDEYGDDPETWPKDISMGEFDWYVPNSTVYVSETYRVEKTKEIVHIFKGLTGNEVRHTKEELEENDGELLEQLKATGFFEARQKKIKRVRVRKYIESGGGILEDCGYIPGKYIPVIPVYGNRVIIDNVERCAGHTRQAKDPQRLKNMQLSKLGEIAALSSVEKPILTPEQLGSHGLMWSRDNIDNYPYLLVEAITDNMGNPAVIGPQAYTRSTQIPAALAALLQITETDMQDILGNPEGGGQINANQSGIAVELQQTRIDMQAYGYISNFAKSVARSATVWYSMNKDLMVEENRKAKVMTEDGEASQVVLMRPMIDEKTSATVYANDFSSSDMEVYVQVGPASSSRKAATVRMLTQMIPMVTDPESQQVLAAMAMYNMEGEGIADVRKWFRQKLLSFGVVTPTKEEQEIMAKQAQESANQPPDPNAVFLQASAQKAQADAIKSQTAAQLDAAKTEQVKAETAKTISDMQMERQDHYMNTLERVGEAVAATTQPTEMGEYKGDEDARR